MDELGRLLMFLAITGGALTLLGALCVRVLDPDRRTRQTLAKILGAQPQPLLIAPKRGQGIGFDLPGGRVATAWDAGGWALAYGIEELLGVELILDDRIAARAHRSSASRPLDQLSGAEERVRLRFLFDDLSYPDFELDLWRAEDDGRRGRLTAEEALHEANRWMGRIESLLRRAPVRKAATAVAAAPVAAPVAAPIAPRASPLFDRDDDAADDFDAEDALG